MKNSTLMVTYPGHLYIDVNRVQMLAKFADFWTDGRLISLLVCICAQMGPTVVSGIFVCVCFNVNDEYLCARTCVWVTKKKKFRKLHFHFWCHAGYKWALGPSDQPLHQFTARLGGLLLLSFSPTSSPSLALCHSSALWLLFHSFAAFPPALGWTLGDVNESHVLCDFPSSLEMIEVQQGRGIWEIIPHLTERQVKDGEEHKVVKRAWMNTKTLIPF